MKTIDAYGMQCPKPLVLAKKEIDEGCYDLAVRVDNETAVKNLMRLGEKTGLAIAVAEIEGGWLVSFAKGESDASAVAAAPGLSSAAKEASLPPATDCGYAVFVGRDTVGDGDAQLGRNLMKMALYTLAESNDAPTSLLFMNAGVSLVAGEELAAVESVRSLQEQGTEVLVCGACLDFYDLKDSLQVGEISNMYDILTRMREAAKVITL